MYNKIIKSLKFNNFLSNIINFLEISIQLYKDIYILNINYKFNHFELNGDIISQTYCTKFKRY